MENINKSIKESIEKRKRWITSHQKRALELIKDDRPHEAITELRLWIIEEYAIGALDRYL